MMSRLLAPGASSEGGRELQGGWKGDNRPTPSLPSAQHRVLCHFSLLPFWRLTDTDEPETLKPFGMKIQTGAQSRELRWTPAANAQGRQHRAVPGLWEGPLRPRASLSRKGACGAGPGVRFSRILPQRERGRGAASTPGEVIGIWGGWMQAWPCTDTGIRGIAVLYNKSLPTGPPELREADLSGGLWCIAVQLLPLIGVLWDRQPGSVDGERSLSKLCPLTRQRGHLSAGGTDPAPLRADQPLQAVPWGRMLKGTPCPSSAGVRRWLHPASDPPSAPEEERVFIGAV